VLVTSKLTSVDAPVYSWLSAVVTLNHTALALNANLRCCWPYGCSAHSLRCQSHRNLAEENALSPVSYPAGDFPTANSECRIPRRAMSVDQVTSQLTSGIAKLVLGSFDCNIFRHQNRQLNEHKYFFYIFRNHRGITLSLVDALCFEKWKFVDPRL